ncbi:hypothetical protein HDU67_003559 [Dinochytrium kinnereticum]|nr:hypothetical protein HDU67_003559 [Dinochytrium kinnereticum]
MQEHANNAARRQQQINSDQYQTVFSAHGPRTGGLTNAGRPVPAPQQPALSTHTALASEIAGNDQVSLADESVYQSTRKTFAEFMTATTPEAFENNAGQLKAWLQDTRAYSKHLQKDVLRILLFFINTCTKPGYKITPIFDMLNVVLTYLPVVVQDQKDYAIRLFKLCKRFFDHVLKPRCYISFLPSVVANSGGTPAEMEGRRSKLDYPPGTLPKLMEHTVKPFRLSIDAGDRLEIAFTLSREAAAFFIESLSPAPGLLPNGMQKTVPAYRLYFSLVYSADLVNPDLEWGQDRYNVWINGIRVPMRGYSDVASKRLGSLPGVDPQVIRANELRRFWDLTPYVSQGLNGLCLMSKSSPSVRLFASVDALIFKDSKEITASLLSNPGSLIKVEESILLAKTRNELDGVPVRSLSLLCPISKARPTQPMRGKNCVHLECFDLNSFLLDGSRRSVQFPCPICGKQMTMENLAIDMFYISVMSKVGPSVSKVLVRSDGAFSAADESPQPVIELASGLGTRSNAVNSPLNISEKRKVIVNSEAGAEAKKPRLDAAQAPTTLIDLSSPVLIPKTSVPIVPASSVAVISSSAAARINPVQLPAAKSLKDAAPPQLSNIALQAGSLVTSTTTEPYSKESTIGLNSQGSIEAKVPVDSAVEPITISLLPPFVLTRFDITEGKANTLTEGKCKRCGQVFALSRAGNLHTVSKILTSHFHELHPGDLWNETPSSLRTISASLTKSTVVPREAAKPLVAGSGYTDNAPPKTQKPSDVCVDKTLKMPSLETSALSVKTGVETATSQHKAVPLAVSSPVSTSAKDILRDAQSFGIDAMLGKTISASISDQQPLPISTVVGERRIEPAVVKGNTSTSTLETERSVIGQPTVASPTGALESLQEAPSYLPDNMEDVKRDLPKRLDSLGCPTRNNDAGLDNLKKSSIATSNVNDSGVTISLGDGLLRVGSSPQRTVEASNGENLEVGKRMDNIYEIVESTSPVLSGEVYHTPTEDPMAVVEIPAIVEDAMDCEDDFMFSAGGKEVDVIPFKVASNFSPSVQKKVFSGCEASRKVAINRVIQDPERAYRDLSARGPSAVTPSRLAEYIGSYIKKSFVQSGSDVGTSRGASLGAKSDSGSLGTRPIIIHTSASSPSVAPLLAAKNNAASVLPRPVFTLGASLSRRTEDFHASNTLIPSIKLPISGQVSGSATVMAKDPSSKDSTRGLQVSLELSEQLPSHRAKAPTSEIPQTLVTPPRIPRGSITSPLDKGDVTSAEKAGEKPAIFSAQKISFAALAAAHTSTQAKATPLVGLEKDLKINQFASQNKEDLTAFKKTGQSGTELVPVAQSASGPPPPSAGKDTPKTVPGTIPTGTPDSLRSMRMVTPPAFLASGDGLLGMQGASVAGEIEEETPEGPAERTSTPAKHSDLRSQATSARKVSIPLPGYRASPITQASAASSEKSVDFGLATVAGGKTESLVAVARSEDIPRIESGKVSMDAPIAAVIQSQPKSFSVDSDLAADHKAGEPAGAMEAQVAEAKPAQSDNRTPQRTSLIPADFEEKRYLQDVADDSEWM